LRVTNANTHTDAYAISNSDADARRHKLDHQ
jgi:hypothetical protein